MRARSAYALILLAQQECVENVLDGGRVARTVELVAAVDHLAGNVQHFGPVGADGDGTADGGNSWLCLCC